MNDFCVFFDLQVFVFAGILCVEGKSHHALDDFHHNLRILPWHQHCFLRCRNQYDEIRRRPHNEVGCDSFGYRVQSFDSEGIEWDLCARLDMIPISQSQIVLCELFPAFSWNMNLS